MPHYTYERLSSAAAALLGEETSRRYAHSGTMLVFESGALGRPDGGVDFEAVRSAIESRLHLVPRYRQKLRWIPIENHPIWVDDHEFNLAYHVRHTSLARPGGRSQLRTTAARLQAQRLDRSRPLWEYWVVEGLEGGRFALLAKTHNALLEGAGADLLQLLLSPDVDAEEPEPPPYRARPVPSTSELLWQEVVRQVRLPRRAMGRWRALASDLDDLPRVLRHRADRFARMLGYSLPGVRETPLNGPIGPHRRVDHLVLPLDEARSVRRALGGTVLDVVLATTAGAVSRYLERHYLNPATLDFRVSVPVGLRSPEKDTGVGEWVLDLPIWERDPAKRFHRIRELTQALQEKRPAVSGKGLFPVDEWIRSTLPGAGARAFAARVPVNLRIANVPGPSAPLFFRGAQMLECFGKVPLADNCGLGIAVFGYDGRICWGLNADFDRVPDLDRFTDALRRSFRELVNAASGRGPLEVVRAS